MDVYERLCEVISKQRNLDLQTALSPKSRLVEELGFDSLGMMRLLTDLEDEFDLFLPDTDFAAMRCIGDLEVLIKEGQRSCA